MSNPSSHSAVPPAPTLVERLPLAEDKTLKRLAPVTFSETGLNPSDAYFSAVSTRERERERSLPKMVITARDRKGSFPSKIKN